MRKPYWAVLLALIVLLLSYPFWKSAIKRTKWGLVLTTIGADTLRQWGIASDQLGQADSLKRSDAQLPVDVAHVHKIYASYLRAASLEPSAMDGKRVLELGPGLNIGVPLLFLADGAEMAVGLDKFVPLQQGPYFQSFYRQLREGLSATAQSRFDEAIQANGNVTLNPKHARYIYGKDVTESVAELGPASYDLIVSNAVIEEIYDPTPVFRAQDQLLKPGGTMVHVIDLRDYDMFSKRGFHPLEFLTVPDWAYRRMTEGSGGPNRRQVGYYRETLSSMGYQSQIWVTNVLGVGMLAQPKAQITKGVDYTDASLQLVNDIRPRLLPRFQSIPDQDLLVRAIILMARKPHTGNVGSISR